MSETGKYIVVFKDTATKEQIDDYANNVNNNGVLLIHAMAHQKTKEHGFAAQIPDTYFQSLQSQSLQSDSIIDYIEPDGVVSIQQQ
ncbi:hypothetical protein H0H92_001952 [Tricholoma furcatifolium]|nr:hypothetical protein H0H92_001952 [Tricholoma furcatifolium]